MPSHVLVNDLGVTHKGSSGMSNATLPDVCKTPTPGGPVPMPYPNFADHSTLTDGTSTVTVKGNIVAVKGSSYSSSHGDEAGTVGGVTSNTFGKETAWITYSFDVKMEGRNVCRHTDKKFHNHKNTVDLAGNMDPVKRAAFEATLCKILKDCNQKLNDMLFRGLPPTPYDCARKTERGEPYPVFIGNVIDKCVKNEITRRKAAKDSTIPRDTRCPEYTPKQMVAVPGGGNCLPDIMIGRPPNCRAVYDIKTKCPPARQIDWPVYRSNLTAADRALLRVRGAPNSRYDGRTQADIYKDACGPAPVLVHPYSDDCK
jgi:hypothetical protein